MIKTADHGGGGLPEKRKKRKKRKRYDSVKGGGSPRKWIPNIPGGEKGGGEKDLIIN